MEKGKPWRRSIWIGYTGWGFDGKITGISPFGELLVEREGKQRAYGHGEISLKIP